MELPQLDCYGAPLQGLGRSGRGRRCARRPLGAPGARAEGVARTVRASRTSTRARRSRTRTECRPTTAARARSGRRSRSCCSRIDGVLPLAPRRAPRGDRSGRRRRAPAPGRLLVSRRTPRCLRRCRRRDGHPSEASGEFAPGPYYPDSRHAARRAPRAAFEHVTYAQGLRPHAEHTTDLAALLPLVRDADVVVCCVGGGSGLLARLHERRVPRRDRPRPAGRAAPARRGRHRARRPGGRRGPERARPRACRGSPGARPRSCTRGARASKAARALADVLFGDVDASGRLPISIPRNVGQIPVHHDHRAGGGRSQMLRRLRRLPRVAALFRSATASPTRRSTTSELEVSDATTAAAFTVSVGVANTGERGRHRSRAAATSATRSPAWLGPASSSRASPGSTSNPDARRGRVHDRRHPARLLRRGHAARRRARGRPHHGRAVVGDDGAGRRGARDRTERSPRDRRGPARLLRITHTG